MTESIRSIRTVVLTSALIVLLHKLTLVTAYDRRTEAIIQRSLLSAVNRGKLVPEDPGNRIAAKKEICRNSRRLHCPYCQNVSIRGLISDVQFLTTDFKTKILTLRPEKLIENNCTDKLLASVSFSLNKTHSYSWRFNDSLESASFLTITSSFPSPPWRKHSGELFGGVSKGPSSSQSVVFEETVLYEDFAEIIIPPLKSAKVSVQSRWLGHEVEIPFQATVEFSTVPERICAVCTSNEKKGRNASECFIFHSSSEGVEEFLREHDFKGEVMEKVPSFLRARVHGLFQGNYAEGVKIVKN